MIVFIVAIPESGKNYIYYDENDQLVVAVDQNYQFTDKAKNIRVLDRIRLDNDTNKLTFNSPGMYEGIYKDVQQMVETDKYLKQVEPQVRTLPQQPTQPVVQKSKQVVKPMATNQLYKNQNKL